MTPVDDTHDPRLRSWVESANVRDTDFPIQNLPLCVFRPQDGRHPRIGVGVGDQILDLLACSDLLGLEPRTAAACAAPSLNALMSLGREARVSLRRSLSMLLRAGTGPSARGSAARSLIAQSETELLLPAEIHDYSDFYASIHHATNVGSMFRPDSPLFPNYKYVPIGYHGRASSIVPSGMPVRRPSGQMHDGGSGPPTFGPSRSLDYEIEVGVLIGPGNALGDTIPITEAEDHVFGLCLVNDWSARDIQRWEYQPLGPFLAKSFATTVSPWVVTLEALTPFRAPAFARPAGDPDPLPHLRSEADTRLGGIAITLEVYLSTRRMRDEGVAPHWLSRGSFTDMYWTVAQLVTHHASNGCNLRPGDLLASGTVSGSTPSSRGCLLELTSRGSEPIQLPGGETRRFLEDGDEVIMRGFCERDGVVRVGFGECRGVVQPASMGA
jgi:fumarylacetoacetase